MLRNENCQERLSAGRKTDVTVAHPGPCKVQGPENCNNFYENDIYENDGPCCKECIGELKVPVCGSNGETYENSCELERYNCKNKVNVVIDHEGACVEKRCQELQCLHDYDEPLCGSDGKTYHNKCHLERENCQHKRTTSIKHHGECCGTVCPTSYWPICGTDGKTYGSHCELGLENCKKKNGKEQGTTVENGYCDYHLVTQIRYCESVTSFPYRASDNWTTRRPRILRG